MCVESLVIVAVVDDFFLWEFYDFIAYKSDLWLFINYLELFSVEKMKIRVL